MVEMRSSIIMKILIPCIYISVGISQLYLVYSFLGRTTGTLIDIFMDLRYAMAIIGAAAINLSVTYVYTLRIILGDYGITKKYCISFLSVPIFKYDSSVSWKKIHKLDEAVWFYGGGIMFFSSEKYNGQHRVILDVNYLLTNRKDALVFAAEKLSRLKFTDAAQNKLRRMGIL